MFRIPVPTLIKPGCFNDLAKITQTQVPNMTRALLVTDKAIRTKTSFITNAESQFGSSNLELFMYDNVPVNPRIETSDEIAALAKENKVDCIIGIGGGSVIDAGKAGSMLATNSKNAREYIGPNKFENQALPFIAIPTTCGTGAEVTWVSVLTDESSTPKRKVSIKGDKMFPKLAFVDSDILSELPKPLIASTSMDALTHALEAYTVNCSNVVGDVLATKAIDCIFRYLPRAYNDIKNDDEARYYVSYASTVAGYTIFNADVAAVHCLSETLGGLYDIPHGVANAALLYPCMKYHEPYIKSKLDILANDIKITEQPLYEMLVKQKGNEVKNMSGGDAFLECIDILRKEVNIPSFVEFGVNEKDFDLVASEAVYNNSNPSNPQEMKKENYLDIIKMAVNENLKAN